MAKVWDRLTKGILENGGWQNITLVLIFAFTLKCLIAQCFFFLSDEAYLVLWGKYLSTGYYDHPPMAGWLAYVMLHFGQSPLLMRLPTILISLAVGLGIYLLLRDFDRQKAYLAFLLFIVSPFDFMLFAMMTDMPLLLFSFFSIFFMFKAQTKQNILYYLLCGVCLGMAFLSKYFAIMIYVGYFLYFLHAKKSKAVMIGFSVLTLAAACIAGQNILWNYQNGWPNFMHNYFNRVEKHANPVGSLSLLAASIAYMVTPLLCYYVYTNRKRFIDCVWKNHFKLLVLVCAVPVFVFILGSFVKEVRPHWVFFVIPLVFILATVLLSHEELVKCIRFGFTVSMIQAAVCCIISFFPVHMLKGVVDNGDLASLMLHLNTDNAASQLDPYKGRFVMATQSYSLSALLEYETGQRTVVFGGGSQHGRQDDIYTDFKELDGKDFAIIVKGDEHIPKFARMFARTEVKTLAMENASINVLLGYGFKYGDYRNKYLVRAVNKFYQIPDWLPYSRSYFHAKYNFDPHLKYTETQYPKTDDIVPVVYNR